MENGSMMKKDRAGVGKLMGDGLVQELHSMGAYFIFSTVQEELEKDFFKNWNVQAIVFISIIWRCNIITTRNKLSR